MTDRKVILDAEAARVARRELDLLIDRTEDEDPDPLQDDIFRARSALDEALERDHDLEAPELITDLERATIYLNGDRIKHRVNRKPEDNLQVVVER